MAKYVFKWTAQYKAKIFRAGDILNFTGEVVVCPDCKGVKKEIVCKLCKDSGRIDPPHHAKLLGDEYGKEKEGQKVLNNKEKEILISDTKKEEVEQLRKQIETLGGSYSKVWGIERLKMHLVKTKKEYGDKNINPSVV